MKVLDADEDAVSEIIIPQLNVSRRDARGLVNPHEAVNQQMICGTSAGTKSSYAYSLLCETFIQAIIDPSNAFVMGLDYRLPAKHGLVDGKFVERQKFSSSYNEATFAAEYGGVWQGGSNEAWFDFEKLTKYRKKKNPEWKQVYEETPNVFYIISVDVGKNLPSCAVMRIE